MHLEWRNVNRRKGRGKLEFKNQVLSNVKIFIYSFGRARDDQKAKGNSKNGKIHLSYSLVFGCKRAYFLMGGASSCSIFTWLTTGSSSTFTSGRDYSGSCREEKSCYESSGFGVLRNRFIKKVPVQLYFLIMSLTVEGLIWSLRPASERLRPCSTTSRTNSMRFCIDKGVLLPRSGRIYAYAENKSCSQSQNYFIITSIPSPSAPKTPPAISLPVTSCHPSGTISPPDKPQLIYSNTLVPSIQLPIKQSSCLLSPLAPQGLCSCVALRSSPFSGRIQWFQKETQQVEVQIEREISQRMWCVELLLDEENPSSGRPPYLRISLSNSSAISLALGRIASSQWIEEERRGSIIQKEKGCSHLFIVKLQQQCVNEGCLDG